MSNAPDDQKGANRLGLLHRDELLEDGQQLHDQITQLMNAHYDDSGVTTQLPDGRYIGPLAIMLRTPSIGSAFFGLSAAISRLAASAKLTPRVRDVAVNTVVGNAKAAYAVYAHGILGKRAGLSDEELDAISTGQRPKTLDEAESVAWEMARDLCVQPERGALQDELWDRGVKVLGEEGAIALVHEVAFYQYISTVLNGFDARRPDGKRWNREEGTWTQ
ncbi:hypothetical protein NA57DRAFT_56895 [Rhizodiscina lignyota]|uniref:Carboxymuconolactone decarboxylase-like domain-containing protein n=1 Tax=Rhizodiscina lignyota TaxID=1504668 RepID=A0A9P4M7V7_9PEZI|nr:hypothetical protein NA57DRAFT_56895 [Rhizodiscina lignyota]